VLVSLIFMLANGPVFSTDVNYSGAYYCRPSDSAGMLYNSQLKTQSKWTATHYMDRPDDAYIVKLSDTGEVTEDEVMGVTLEARVVTISVKVVGSDHPAESCRNSTIPSSIERMKMFGETIRCSDSARDYLFNFKNRRFQTYYEGQFVNPNAEESRSKSPQLSIGSCEKIE